MDLNGLSVKAKEVFYSATAPKNIEKVVGKELSAELIDIIVEQVGIVLSKFRKKIEGEGYNFDDNQLLLNEDTPLDLKGISGDTTKVMVGIFEQLNDLLPRGRGR